MCSPAILKRLASLFPYLLLVASCGGGSDTTSVREPTEAKDTSAPVITVNGDLVVNMKQGQKYSELGASASDNVDGEVTVSVSGDVDNFTPGEYLVSYKATDTAGNSSEVNRTVIVQSFRPFVSRWDTRAGGVSGPDQISIATAGQGFDYTVAWGDGSVDYNVNGNTTHTYQQAGEYTVSIYGEFPHFYMEDIDCGNYSPYDCTFFYQSDHDKLISIEQWGDIVWRSMHGSFRGVTQLTFNAGDLPNLSQVKDMSAMFKRAKVHSLDVSNWDVSAAVDMSSMFEGAKFEEIDISAWDVSNVTNMRAMFKQTKFTSLDVSAWNVENVTDLTAAFSHTKTESIDLSNWDVTNVEDMRGLFMYSKFSDLDLSRWQVSNVRNMAYMFAGAKMFNQDVGHWDVTNVTDMSCMLTNAESFDQDIGRWDVSNVKDMFSMFAEAEAFNRDISDWNVAQVINMARMFDGAVHFDQSLAKWDVSKVSTMSRMFTDVTLSIENYTNLLINWSELELVAEVSFDAGNSQYQDSATSARDRLEQEFGWSISDAGVVVANSVTQPNSESALQTDSDRAREALRYRICEYYPDFAN